MIIKLIELKNPGGAKAELGEVFVNTEHIVCVRAAPQYRITNENNLPDGLDERTTFSRVFLDHAWGGLVLTVVGEPTVVESRINEVNRRLLQG